MPRNYISKYTGNQVDEAVRAIVENDIQLEDLSQALVNEIHNWIGEGKVEVFFGNRSNFPEEGQDNMLYVALDQLSLYIWNSATKQYIKMTGGDSQFDYDEINGGGAA